MKPIGLISRKARDLRERFARVPQASVAFVTVLAVVALLGGTAATAQAATTAPAAATCTAGENPVVDEHHGTPLFGYVPGNGNVNLYFDNSGDATCFYTVSIYDGGVFAGYQIYDGGPADVCLAVDASTQSIHEGSAAACMGAASYTLWTFLATSPSSQYQLFKSNYNGECIYDDTQRPATYSACAAADQFEWLTLTPQMQ
jgi:hypothetical protein